MPVIYGFTDPERAKQIIKEHPTYISGMVGATLGAVAAATKHIHKMDKEKSQKEDLEYFTRNLKDH